MNELDEHLDETDLELKIPGDQWDRLIALADLSPVAADPLVEVQLAENIFETARILKQWGISYEVEGGESNAP